MRTIKFRFWDIEDKEMSFPLTLGDMFSGHDFTYDDEGETGIAMQFTGLLDKNGKEIYEGDIIKQKFGNRELIASMYFNEDKAQFGFDMEIESDKNLPEHIELHTRSEIIGNIYENADLLKVN